MNIETGDIILVRGSTPIISPLIRWFTGSEYTHAGIAITSDWIFEIDMNQDLALRPVKRHKDFDVFRYKDGLTVDQKTRIIQKAERRARNNKGYDWLKILGFIFEKLFRTQFVFDSINHVICSEIVDLLYDAVGIDLLPDRKTGHVTPGDIAKSPVLKKIDYVVLKNVS